MTPKLIIPCLLLICSPLIALGQDDASRNKYSHAGAIICSWDKTKNEPVILLGYEPERGWMNFVGERDPGEREKKTTAAREISQETTYYRLKHIKKWLNDESRVISDLEVPRGFPLYALEVDFNEDTTKFECSEEQKQKYEWLTLSELKSMLGNARPDAAKILPERFATDDATGELGEEALKDFQIEGLAALIEKHGFKKQTYDRDGE